MYFLMIDQKEPTPTRGKVLETVDRLFYHQGIRAVVDRVPSSSGTRHPARRRCIGPSLPRTGTGRRLPEGTVQAAARGLRRAARRTDPERLRMVCAFARDGRGLSRLRLPERARRDGQRRQRGEEGWLSPTRRAGDSGIARSCRGSRSMIRTRWRRSWRLLIDENLRLPCWSCTKDHLREQRDRRRRPCPAQERGDPRCRREARVSDSLRASCDC